jgi:UDP-N-acetylmuramoylalanine--D-glutamate ligase
MTEEKVILRELTVPGEHMRTNVLNAALVLYLMGVEPERIISILGNWQGIEHRLQYFHSWHSPKNANKEYKFFNDTCATVPEAAAAATQAFGKPVILLTGGTDKGLVLNPLIQVLTNKKPEEIAVKSIYLLQGSATDRLIPYLDSSNTAYKGPYPNLDELLAALKQSLLDTKDTSAGSEVVVFSPGATSFGLFNNEFDRGEQFMNKVKTLF